MVCQYVGKCYLGITAYALFKMSKCNLSSLLGDRIKRQEIIFFHICWSLPKRMRTNIVKYVNSKTRPNEHFYEQYTQFSL